MTDENDKREAAVRRVEAKRGFRVHVAIYLVVNALLVVVWALSGAGYFWPIWPMLGWGIGLAFHAWGVYFQKPISEDEIRREMERGHRDASAIDAGRGLRVDKLGGSRSPLSRGRKGEDGA